ncbi:pentapeptide repeat-containing protein [Catenulispora yoronensis]|uniref:Pentapeptide repeat-containing protein n=1 Tax=Catenulispora yoronensis TaxID=450799 RepID=A0ABP5FQ10_9ACTN
MRSATPNHPPRPDLPPETELSVLDLPVRDEGHYECQRVDGASWEDVFASHARFSQCLLSDVTVTGGEWSKTTFADVRVADSRLLGPDLSASHWRDTELVRGIASGVQWHDADVRRVHFDQVKLDAVNFRGAALTDVVFTDCLLREADFGGTKMTRVRFPGCTFEDADFSRAKLSDVDLRGARLHFKAGFDALRGATIDGGQLVELAPALAGHVGLRIA